MDWLRGKAAFLTASLLTISLILAELLHNTISIDLNPVRKYSMLSYEAAGSHGPPIMVIWVIIITIGSAVPIRKRSSNQWI